MTRRPGFTLIETLVVVALIGLLVALLLPAVQSARSSAQRASCLNNLRQVGLAVQNYVGAYSAFPATFGQANPPITAAFQKQYSVFACLLPYLEQQSLFAAINFDVGLHDPYIYQKWIFGGEANETVMATTLGVLLCPADGGAGDLGWTGATNYRANLGSDRWYTASDPTRGPFSFLDGSAPTSTAASITDGLSNTAAIADKLRGRASATAPNLRTDMIIAVTARLGHPYSVADAVEACATIHGTPDGFFPTVGLSWFVGSLTQSCYNHTIGPNALIPDCVLRSTDPNVGLVGARSNHPGGVNVALADGSVRFVSNSVQLTVWRALGTAGGGEVVSASDY